MAMVLVTGGSGFIGSHAILQLLAAGHAVRTTVRSLEREGQVRAMLKAGGGEAGERLTFIAADLEKDAGWKEAASGCEYALHVASPLPPGAPKHEDELIVPAREGALRVLRAARAAGVRRVVLTSSFAAIGYGHAQRTEPFDERDWTDPTAPGLSAYVKSKTLAERAAWDFIAREGGGLELAVVNPVLVLGPVLAADYSASILLVKTMLEGGLPGCPRLYYGLVDVRDVADLHVRAMTHPAAKGERFLALGSDFVSMREMALLLKERMGAVAAKVKTRELPDWLIRLLALWNAQARMAAPEVGKVKRGNNAKARTVLGWAPRSNGDALAATAESLLRLGLLKG